MKRRWNNGPAKPRRPIEEIITERDQRRAADIARCTFQTIETNGAREVSYELISEKLGLPLDFLMWSFPTLESLLATGLRYNEAKVMRSTGGSETCLS